MPQFYIVSKEGLLLSNSAQTTNWSAFATRSLTKDISEAGIFNQANADDHGEIFNKLHTQYTQSQFSFIDCCSVLVLDFDDAQSLLWTQIEGIMEGEGIATAMSAITGDVFTYDKEISEWSVNDRMLDSDNLQEIIGEMAFTRKELALQINAHSDLLCWIDSEGEGFAVTDISDIEFEQNPFM